MDVLVFSTKFAVGYPDPPNQTETTVTPLHEALTKSYTTDAHFVAYMNPIHRRVRVEAIGVVPIEVNLLVGDVDDPVSHKKRARDEWREVEHKKIEKLFEKHPRAFVYETRGGYRVMFALPAPFEIKTAEDKTRWWSQYLAFRSYLAREFSITIDPACKDFTRFYRLPNVVRDGKSETFITFGDPADIETLSLAVAAPRKKPPKYVKAALESAVADVRNAPVGTRNEALNKAAYSLGGFIPESIDRDTVHDALLFAILANGGDEDTDAKKIEAAIDAGMARPRAIPSGSNGVGGGASYAPPPLAGSASDDGETASFTDVANAEKLVARHLDELRYVATWGKWIFWDGKRWTIDNGDSALRYAVLTARAMMKEAREHMNAATEYAQEAAASGDDDAILKSKSKIKWAMKAIDWAQKSHSRPRLEAMLAVACADQRIAIRHDKLDTDKWLLNVENGTIDLRTGLMRSHLREDLITKITHVEYSPIATAPTWKKFLNDVMAGDNDLVSYLSRAIGYSLTGEIRDHVIVFFHGETGSNGKSTFLQTIHKMMGEYAMPAARNLLFRGKSDRHPTELATLHGKRFVVCSEIEDGQAFDEGLVKDLTGGDPINARRMREDEWRFEPTHKLFIAGNHKPRVRGTDGGIWRRIHLVPWLVNFEDRKDMSLPAKLEAELPGILTWAVQSCIEWQRAGLAPPGGVREATQAYREESNPLGEFVALRCKLDTDAKVSRRTLREAYERYCRDNGDKFPLGSRAFAAKIRALGVGETTMKEPNPLTGVVSVVDAWRGIRLWSAEELIQRESPTRDQALTN